MSTAGGDSETRPYYIIVAGLPGVLEVLDVNAHTVNAKLSAMARSQTLHTFDLPNDVILTISLQYVHHWTVTPERPKDILIVPVTLPG
jgi:hypothetical protein